MNNGAPLIYTLPTCGVWLDTPVIEVSMTFVAIVLTISSNPLLSLFIAQFIDEYISALTLIGDVSAWVTLAVTIGIVVTLLWETVVSLFNFGNSIEPNVEEL